jgi:hypothetical protein
MRLPFQQEEIWNIVTEQVRNSCTATSHSSPANQPVRMEMNVFVWLRKSRDNTLQHYYYHYVHELLDLYHL